MPRCPVLPAGTANGPVLTPGDTIVLVTDGNQ